MVAVELEVLAKKFDRFGWERDRGSAAHDRQITDWMDALQDYPLSEVQAACKAAVINNPNKMPNEGHVVAEIKKARAQFLARQPKEDKFQRPANRMTPEQAKAVLQDAGVKLNKFGGVESL